MEKLSNLELIIENQIKLERVDIFAQPIVNLKNSKNKKPHFEILSRFYDNFGNLIMPEGIFSGNRTTNELLTLDKLIFNRAFEVLGAIKDTLGENYTAAINVSEASIIGSGYFLESVEEFRKKYSLNSRNIQLEITERSDKCVKPFIEKALNFGYSISVDDFASKNFTIGKLRKQILEGRTKEELEKVKVKIDMQFILDLINQHNPHFNIDRAVVNLALAIRSDFPQINIVAEGIENIETANYLKNFGVDFGQGYLWGKPKLLSNDYIQPIFNNFSS